MAVVIGIDPGHTGGIAVMEPGGRVLRTYRMPITRGDRPSLDLMQLEYILTHQESHVTMAAIEQVRPQGNNNGAVGMAAMMRGIGQIEGLIFALRLSRQEVPPQSWQKLLVGVPHPRAPKGASEAEKARARNLWKAEVVKAAQRRWPAVDLIASTHGSAKESSGVADALWICEFARLLQTAGAIQPLANTKG